MKNAQLILEYPLQVPFYDVDIMEIVWHGHYVKYLEEARCAWLAHLGYDYQEMKNDGYIWPVVQLQLKYIRPATFRQQLIVRVGLKEFETCLRLDYEIIARDSGEKLTTASTMQIAVRCQDQETQFQTPEKWQNLIRMALVNSPDLNEPM